MKKIRKTLALVLVITIASGSTCTGFAAPATESSIKAAYLSQDVTVEYNREVLSFKDANGEPVYPITYNGSTYLPIRAISGLMGEPIEWAGKAKTVYIGRTISNPVKKVIDHHDSPYVTVVSPSAIDVSAGKTVVQIREQRNILVMYDFETIAFKNEQGTVIYPINYNGSNYLPLRSAAELMNEEIVWDGKTKTVYIGSMTPIEEEPEDITREETVAIKELFDKTAEVYNLATTNISGIAGWTNESAPVMAAAISDNLAVAKECMSEIKSLLKTETFTEEEALAAQRLYEFIEITEYYILVMENIAYMEAANQDYSMLAELFLNCALASEQAMKTAMEAIECL